MFVRSCAASVSPSGITNSFGIPWTPSRTLQNQRAPNREAYFQLGNKAAVWIGLRLRKRCPVSFAQGSPKGLQNPAPNHPAAQLAQNSCSLVALAPCWAWRGLRISVSLAERELDKQGDHLLDGLNGGRP